jgi:hypothetical protein
MDNARHLPRGGAAGGGLELVARVRAEAEALSPFDFRRGYRAGVDALAAALFRAGAGGVNEKENK